MLREALAAQNGGEGESQPEAAARLGISQSHVSQMMTGKTRPGMPLLNRICRLYGIDREEAQRVLGYLDDLRDDQDEPLEEIVRRATREGVEEAVSRLLGNRVHEPAPLTYEPDPDAISIAGFDLSDLTPAQRKQVEEFVRDLRSRERGIHE